MLLTGTMFKIQLTNQVEVNSEEITVTFNDVKGVSQLLFYDKSLLYSS